MDKKEIERAYKYLERVQVAYMKYNGMVLSDYYLFVEDLEHFPEQHRDILSNMIISSPEDLTGSDKYEKNTTYQLLKECVSKIDTPAIKEKIIQDFKIREQDNLIFPVWGTVPAYEFSAEICPFDSNIKLIMISDAVFTSAYLLVKIIDNIMFSRDDTGLPEFNLTYEDMRKHLNENYILQQRFNDFLGSIFFCKTPIFAKQYFNEASIFRSVMLDGFEIFVVAHEYAHSLCGHMNKRYMSANGISKVLSYAEVEMVCHEWEDEFEADSIGAYITLMAIKYNDFSKWVRFMGIYLCLSMMELQEKISALKECKISFSRTHPPALERKKMLLKKFFPKGKPEVYDNIDKILDELWNTFLLTLKKVTMKTLKRYGPEAANLSLSLFQEAIYNET